MLSLIGPFVFCLAAGLKLRRIADPEQRPLALALLALAAALTLDVPQVYAALDRAVEVPNVANLAEHALALIGVFLLLTFLGQVSGQARWTWGRSLALVVALTTITVLFSLAAPQPEASDFTRAFEHLAPIKAYWIVTIAYFGLCLAALLRLAIGHARQSARREVRVGFAAVGAGVVVGVAYSALKIVELLITGDAPALELVDNVALVTGAVLIGGGFVYPLAISSVEALRHHVRARLLLVQLRPAWRTAVARRPGVVLGRQPHLADDLVGRHVMFRLYRRLIEIQDAALESGEELPPSIATLLGDAASVSRAHVAGAVG